MSPASTASDFNENMKEFYQKGQLIGTIPYICQKFAKKFFISIQIEINCKKQTYSCSGTNSWRSILLIRSTSFFTTNSMTMNEFEN